MSANKKQSLVFFLTVLLCISLIVYANMSDTSKVVREFVIENAKLLPADVYKLDIEKKLNPAELQNADAIRKVILAHPYIKSCDFYYPGPNKLVLKVIEIDFVALAQTSGDGCFLLSDRGAMIEDLPGTRPLDLPVVGGVIYKSKYLSKQDSAKILTAITIINCFGKTDADLLKEVSEIVEVAENQPAVILRGYTSPFLITLQGLNKQAVYLQALLKERSEYHGLLTEARYVDMRYDKHIFIGKDKKSELE